MQPTAWQLLKSPAALCSQSRWMGNAVYSFEKSVKLGLKQSKIAQCHLGLCCAAFCVSKLKSALLSWGTIATSSSCTFQSSLKGGVWCSKLDAVDQNKIFSSLLLLPPLCPRTAVPSLSDAFRAPKWTGQAAFFGFFLSLCWATCHVLLNLERLTFHSGGIGVCCGASAGIASYSTNFFTQYLCVWNQEGTLEALWWSQETFQTIPDVSFQERTCIKLDFFYTKIGFSGVPGVLIF